MVQVNRVCLKILFINRPQFLVDSNVVAIILNSKVYVGSHVAGASTRYYILICILMMTFLGLMLKVKKDSEREPKEV